MKIFRRYLSNKSKLYKRWNDYSVYRHYQFAVVLLLLPIFLFIIFSSSKVPDASNQTPVCPNNIKEGTEQCDGLSGQSCASLGLGTGAIGCTKNCVLDTTQCSLGTPALVQCNDGIDNADPEDALVDMNDPGCTGPTDNNETDVVSGGSLQCNDHLDNDGDGRCDVFGAMCTDGSIPGDTGCTDINDNSEVGPSTGVWNHSYPRLANQHFGRSPADWYARFDVIVTVDKSGGRIAPIKNLNPEAKVIYTQAVIGDGGGPDDPNKVCSGWHDNFLLRMSNGEIAVANSGWSVRVADMTNLGPCGAGTGACNAQGKRFNQEIPKCLADYAVQNGYDGGGTDWIWDKPNVKPLCSGDVCKDDVDFDRNGVNDYDEYPTGWVRARWREGIGAFVANWRIALGANPVLWLNSGKLHDDLDVPNSLRDSNGLMFERKSGFDSFSFAWNSYKQWINQGRKPSAWITDIRPNLSDSWSKQRLGDTRSYWELMRMMLAWTLMGNGYFEFNPAECVEHHCYSYFDEYDVPLGQPTSPPYTLPNGTMARFFGGGVAIMNPTSIDKTVTDADLRGLQGYAGPYRRFKGNQDPVHNDGSVFSSVLLKGHSFGINSPQAVGDGILLVKTQATIVSDIIIDNINHFTSPGSLGASLEPAGAWTNNMDKINSWSHKEAAGKGLFSYASNTITSTKAVFHPTINVAGRYEVYEWHGETPRAEKTGVIHTIKYAGGVSTTRTVNQAVGFGQWNSLGIYQFSGGVGEGVEISGAGTLGSVQADAIMFRYRGQ